MDQEQAARTRTVTWSDPRAIAKAGRGRPGLEVLREMMEGRVPPPPIIALMGNEMAEVREGFVGSCTAARWRRCSIR